RLLRGRSDELWGAACRVATGGPGADRRRRAPRRPRRRAHRQRAGGAGSLLFGRVHKCHARPPQHPAPTRGARVEAPAPWRWGVLFAAPASLNQDYEALLADMRSRLPDLKLVAFVGGRRGMTWDDLLASAGAIADGRLDAALREVGPEDLAFVLYTSGS